MPNSRFPLLIASTALIAVTGGVALASPTRVGAVCSPGKPSVVIHVAGFKQATGKVKISLYGGDSSRWLAKGGKIGKVNVPVTGRAMDICMPVPAPGRYAVAVHHDFNLNGERDRQDGGGYSRNPKVSLLNPKPSFSKAAFSVGNDPARVGVTLVYVRGLSVGPAGS